MFCKFNQHYFNSLGHIRPGNLRIKILFVFVVILVNAGVKAQVGRPNVLLIVADDLNYDSPGFAGGVAPEVTPNIDRLAGESFRFNMAFATVSVCQPSRQSMLSGLIPHHYGSAGFFPMKQGTPTLTSMLGESGFLTGNIHKKHHMLPAGSFNWDYDNKSLGLTDPDGIVGRDPEAIAGALHRFIELADKNDQPFFMVVNSADPHRPFYGDKVQPGSWYWGSEEIKLKDPSRVYKAEEVIVPPTLPDIPDIRKDLANYASSVRRLDDTMGECLQVLNAMHKDSSTLVIFVSDNGMPLPFAKFDCYIGSNLSPLLMRWPGHIRSGKVDNEHLVSLMDITPTVLELTGLPVPGSLDGRSLVTILEGKTPEEWRQSVVFIRNDDIFYPEGIKGGLKNNPSFINDLELNGWVSRPDHPQEGTYSRKKEIRTYYDGRIGYIYNNCYKENGMQNGALGSIVPYFDPSLRAMKNASSEDPAIEERYEFYLLREREELYDWSADPGSQNNLINDPDYSEVLFEARKGLLQWMLSSGDPLEEDYQDFLKARGVN